MKISEPLLPTPEAKNHVGYQNSHGKQYPRLGKLISLLADSPVSLFPQPDSGEVRPTTATSGQKCLRLFDLQNRNGSSLRTFAVSLLLGEAWFSSKCVLTWKAQVTKSSRLLFQLSPSTPRIAGTEFGLLPTATQWNYKGKRNGLARGRGLDINDRLAMLKTPGASEGVGGVMEIRPTADGKYKMRDQVIGALGGKSNGWKLQPGFVEWMMGFPEGWTEVPDSKLLEMRSSHKSRSK